MIGNGEAILSNRISHFFDLRGPSIKLDTGCSGGLVALHQARLSLWTGEASQAIVGGTNLILAPEVMVSLSAIRFFSEQGRCFSYDQRAGGYGGGEGVAAIIIKPLAQSLVDGDPIRAVIRSTAINQDGWTPGITLPSSAAQISLIKAAYEKAGLKPSETAYCEAHLTGTAAGDPLEAFAIAQALGGGRSSDNPIYVGSIKTTIGHLESVSGLAGVTKTVLMLENGKIVPNHDFQVANNKIEMHEWNTSVPTALMTWPVSEVIGLLLTALVMAVLTAMPLEYPDLPVSPSPHPAGRLFDEWFLYDYERIPRGIRSMASPTASPTVILTTSSVITLVTVTV